MIEYVTQCVGLSAPPSGGGWEFEFLSEHSPAKAREKGHEGRGFNQTATQCIGDRDIAGAHRFDETRNTKVRVGTQLNGITETIVQAPQNDIDGFQTFECFQEYPAIAHRQIAALNQGETQITSEIGVFEIGLVVRAGSQQDDAGIGARAGRKAQQGVPEGAEKRSEPLYLELAE